MQQCDVTYAKNVTNIGPILGALAKVRPKNAHWMPHSSLLENRSDFRKLVCQLLFPPFSAMHDPISIIYGPLMVVVVAIGVPNMSQDINTYLNIYSIKSRAQS